MREGITEVHAKAESTLCDEWCAEYANGAQWRSNYEDARTSNKIVLGFHLHQEHRDKEECATVTKACRDEGNRTIVYCNASQ